MSRTALSRLLLAIALLLACAAISFALHRRAHLAVLAAAFATLAWATRPEIRR